MSLTELKPHFDRTINWGHVLTAITVVMSTAVSFGGAALYISSQQLRSDLEINALKFRADKAEKSTDLAVELGKINAERISAAGASIREIRDAQTQTFQRLGVIGEDIAAIKARQAAQPQR